MESLRRTLLASALTAIVVLGCGPSVKLVSGSSPGVSSQTYLSSNTPTMVFDVIPTTGHHPTQPALDLLVERANEHCDKPGGITVKVEDEVPTPARAGVHRWSYAELVAFESAHSKIQTTNEQAVITILYVEGVYEPNEAAIAISYTAHSIAIFTDMLGPAGPEGPALVHELGHQMGLVNGTSRQVAVHEDVTHGMHDLNPRCVMFFSLDPRGDESTPNDYCVSCKADLKAAGAR